MAGERSANDSAMSPMVVLVVQENVTVTGAIRSDTCAPPGEAHKPTCSANMFGQPCAASTMLVTGWDTGKGEEATDQDAMFESKFEAQQLPVFDEVSGSELTSDKRARSDHRQFLSDRETFWQI